jgi:hypothetical protein
MTLETCLNPVRLFEVEDSHFEGSRVSMLTNDRAAKPQKFCKIRALPSCSKLLLSPRL